MHIDFIRQSFRVSPSITMTFLASMISWRLLLPGSLTSSAGDPPKFPFSLVQKKSILLLVPSSIPVDALFQCTCPLLFANIQGHLSWHVADSLCYTSLIILLVISPMNQLCDCVLPCNALMLSPYRTLVCTILGE